MTDPEPADIRQFKLDHRWARAQMSAYIDGDLADRRRGRMEAHLARCERCQHLLAGLRATISAVRALPSPASPTTPDHRAAAVNARLNG